MNHIDESINWVESYLAELAVQLSSLPERDRQRHLSSVEQYLHRGDDLAGAMDELGSPQQVAGRVFCGLDAVPGLPPDDEQPQGSQVSGWAFAWVLSLGLAVAVLRWFGSSAPVALTAVSALGLFTVAAAHFRASRLIGWHLVLAGAIGAVFLWVS
ncbi:MAG: hypothetical protein CSA58_11340 [Micrococcales bacterium]|nr:MAG: hypothetical protein CSA58_11340 [Micrococcales bacterium]